jgi:hypothetical protein
LAEAALDAREKLMLHSADHRAKPEARASFSAGDQLEAVSNQ